MKPLRISRRGLLVGLGGAGVVAGAGALGAWRLLRPATLEVESLSDVARRELDVCIIGSGPAGAALGSLLVERGVRTCVLESGVPIDRPAPPGWDPRTLDVYESTGDTGYPVHATRMRAAGGTSNLWTGRCSRLHPLDFEPNAYTPAGNPWPLRYEELEPFYTRAEAMLRVTGGALSRYHAPRRAPLPEGDPDDSGQLRDFLADLDVEIDPSPTSHARWRQGPMRAAPDLLPGVARSRHGSVVTDATVTRLVAEPSGRITGAEVRSTRGDAVSLRAETFVVACGAIESARLLLLSRGTGHADGLGNASGWVGRGFNEHPNLNFLGTLPDETPGYALGRSHQFYDAWKQQGRGSVILVFGSNPGRPRVLRIGASLEMVPRADSRVTLTPGRRDAFGTPGVRLALGWDPLDRDTLERTRGLIRELLGRLDAVDIRERDLSWSHHQMGTTRMGDDPATSVVDASLRVHGTQNLYVLGSGVFVTGGAAHPTLGIVAFAHRLADHLAPA